jgi:hypothetical protein
MTSENTENNAENRVRKVRSDKGLVMATRRDQYCIAWIADQYAARGDQIRRLLSRFPDKQRPFRDGKLMAETTVKDQIARWQRAGWVEYKRVLADQPGWAWVTKKGLQLVGRDDLYTAREPASTRLNHIYAVNQLRLWLDSKYAWKSERRYRAEELSKQDGKKAKKGDSLGPIPDGVLVTDKGAIAVEVEISAKRPADLEEKLARLARWTVFDSKKTYDHVPVFPTIWFYVPNDQIKELIRSACLEALNEEERGRVAVGIETDLIASKHRPGR